MNKEFSKFQKETQVKNDFDLKYFALGLCGEVGEVANEIKKLERDDNNVLTKGRKEKIITELGDSMWYIAGICNTLDVEIDDLLHNNIDKLKKNCN